MNDRDRTLAEQFVDNLAGEYVKGRTIRARVDADYQAGIVTGHYRDVAYLRSFEYETGERKLPEIRTIPQT